MAVRMELSRILIRELSDLQIIELREVTEPDADGAPTDSEVKGRTFPIVIGSSEASAIERRLKGVAVKRPMTHDLLASVITSLSAKLESISITDLSDHTFFATLDVRTREGELIHVDSRPSDAIALGIAGGVPIYVEERVLDAAVSEES